MSMSYYEGRGLIFGGLFELGLSFVIKVRWKVGNL